MGGLAAEASWAYHNDHIRDEWNWKNSRQHGLDMKCEMTWKKCTLWRCRCIGFVPGLNAKTRYVDDPVVVVFGTRLGECTSPDLGSSTTQSTPTYDLVINPRPVPACSESELLQSALHLVVTRYHIWYKCSTTGLRKAWLHKVGRRLQHINTWNDFDVQHGTGQGSEMMSWDLTWLKAVVFW